MLTEKMKQLRAKIAEKRSAVNTQVTAAKERANLGELEAAKEIKEKIDSLKTEIADLEVELSDLEEIDGLEEQDLEEVEENGQKEGETRSMPNKKKILTQPNEERAFATYIRTKGAETRDLNSTSGGVFIPKDVVNEVFELKENELDLAKLA
ncbi:phage major capsid protein, partial [Bacillus sp. mrc49]|uniref:phage major capsid protein n=1 Tax=Bacillus sp. mrc49 TaxID=2054913 RepID=UPI000C27ECCD